MTTFKDYQDELIEKIEEIKNKQIEQDSRLTRIEASLSR